MIWQTKKWQEMLKSSNQVEKTIIIKENSKEIFIEKRKISLGETALFILGFDVKDYNLNLEKKLVDICKKETALFFQVETFSYEGNISIISKKFKNSHFKNFITPFSAIIDLKDSEEDILNNMKPKGRYNIKLAKKKGVEIKRVEKTDENIQIFTDLITETALRDNFMMNSNFHYYKTFLKKLDFSELIFAYKDNLVISAGIFTFQKDLAIYYYGASTSNKRYRNLMAPYLIQWEAIMFAKQKNCKIYDFLGVAAPGKIDDELIGVTNFKLKFTRDIREVSRNYIFINKKLKYFIMNNLRKIQKKLKNLKKSL